MSLSCTCLNYSPLIKTHLIRLEVAADLWPDMLQAGYVEIHQADRAGKATRQYLKTILPKKLADELHRNGGRVPISVNSYGARMGKSRGRQRVGLVDLDQLADDRERAAWTSLTTAPL